MSETMTPFAVYQAFLSIKNHFDPKTRHYDCFTHAFQVRAKEESFLKRKDRIYFEKMSRKLTSQEIIRTFIAGMVEATSPRSLYIRDFISPTGEHSARIKENVSAMKRHY